MTIIVVLYYGTLIAYLSRSFKLVIVMLRKRANLGQFLSIAAFAMLTMTQWLHSPLHHLAEHVDSQQATQVQHGCQHGHSKTHQHDAGHSTHTHKHSHHQHSNHGHHGDECPSHPHPNDNCETCLLLANSLDQIQASACLSGVELVEVLPDSSVLILDDIQDAQVDIRGPPVA